MALWREASTSLGIWKHERAKQQKNFDSKRPPPLLPATNSSPAVTSLAAISSYSQQPYYNIDSQDVRSSLNSSAASSYPSTASRQGLPSHHTSSLDRGHSSYQHVSITQQPLREDSSLQHLANHYGIPWILPAPPRSKQKQSEQQPIQQPDFESLRNNYLNMLAQKPDNTVTAKGTMNPQEIEALQSVAETLLASPEFQDVNSFLTSPFEASRDDFGTSPLIDTPYESFGTSPLLDTPLFDDFNTSPIDDSPFISDLNTPILQDADLDMYAYQGMPLIADAGAGMYESIQAPAPAPVEKASVLANGSIDLDNLLKLSPQNPAVDSVYPSPAMTTNESFPAPPDPAPSAPSAPSKTTGRKPTGTRRNITPASLVPYDAPTQARRYITPSATSRKEVPAVFARKRNREQAQLDDEQDELEPLPPNPTEKQQIEWKRRQNTLAARKSRKRKLEYQQNLEVELAELRVDREKWKTRAEVLRGMLARQGVVMDNWPEA
ncbi:cross-pathway control protein [Moniliophthora roreri]|nr:cross-pathway control protein [Moniliophthora roreri]